jgi:hypothetical protein
MSIHNIYRELQNGRSEVSSTNVQKIMQTEGNLAYLAYGQTVPTDGTAGYLPGCIFFDTNAAGGTSTAARLLTNKGSGTSAVFTSITID